MSIRKPHEARDEIQFTPINHIDIWPVECDIENGYKEDIYSLESVEEEKIENENFKFEVNWSYEIDTDEKQEDLEIDAFEDRHKDTEGDLPLIAFGSKSKADDDDIEQPCIQTNNFSKPRPSSVELSPRLWIAHLEAVTANQEEGTAVCDTGSA
ncbi:unnamed protein product [Parnassius apollo]|uniref:(apollo) hypothetical protein n=1 Tax=Parnassius apollo TaxID=110799 RepID=A0A8S3XRI7_PARAO|nr:unnamed protein product [Parnassius apollo]